MKKTLGNERNGNTQYAGPYDVERDTNGNVFVSDSFNHRILKYDISGKVVGKWGSLFGAGGPLGYGSLPDSFMFQDKLQRIVTITCMYLIL